MKGTDCKSAPSGESRHIRKGYTSTDAPSFSNKSGGVIMIHINRSPIDNRGPIRVYDACFNVQIGYKISQTR